MSRAGIPRARPGSSWQPFDENTLMVGTHQPYQTLAAANAAAVSGDTIFLTSGTYTVDDEELKSGVTYRGEGWEKTILTGSSGGDVVGCTSVANVTIEDLCIWSTGGSTDEGITITGAESGLITLRRVGVRAPDNGCLVHTSFDGECRIEECIGWRPTETSFKLQGGTIYINNCHGIHERRNVVAANISVANDTFTIANHRFDTADPVFYEEGGAAITNLTDETLYYAIKVDADTIQLATSVANANAGTEIDLGGTPSGTYIISACSSATDECAFIDVGSTSSPTVFMEGNFCDIIAANLSANKAIGGCRFVGNGITLSSGNVYKVSDVGPNASFASGFASGLGLGSTGQNFYSLGDGSIQSSLNGTAVNIDETAGAGSTGIQYNLYTASGWTIGTTQSGSNIYWHNAPQGYVTHSYGGGTTDYTITEATPMFINLTNAGGAVDLVLPPEREVRKRAWFIQNQTGQTVTVKDDGDAVTIATITDENQRWIVVPDTGNAVDMNAA